MERDVIEIFARRQPFGRKYSIRVEVVQIVGVGIILEQRVTVGPFVVGPQSLTGAQRADEQLGFEFVRSQQIDIRSEEHTSELQSLMHISYAVFCLQKKKKNK